MSNDSKVVRPEYGIIQGFREIVLKDSAKWGGTDEEIKTAILAHLASEYPDAATGSQAYTADLTFIFIKDPDGDWCGGA